jgi:hypothetical protein
VNGQDKNELKSKAASNWLKSQATLPESQPARHRAMALF